MTDFIVIGGGIAGVSAAAHLAPHGSVTLVEMESALAYHTTGRSAALFVVNYGAQGSRPLGRASRAFLENPPQGSTDAPLVTPRGLLWTADETQMPGLVKIAEEGEESEAGSRLIPPDEVLGLVPVLNPDHIAGGLFEPSARDIDVAALQQAFVRIARMHDTEIRTQSPVTAIERKGSGWIVKAGGDTLTCGSIVNASGAWGDRVAALANIESIGLDPMRRTAFMVPGNQGYARWPMVVDADQRFYFKPDGVQLLCSLAEEEPSEPTDAKPRMEDVALAIELINEATTLGIRSVNSQWTGLRTFSPDRDLVIGEEPTAPGFFWLVGQGGTGIQTSPAYGALLASQVIGTEIPELLAEEGVDPSTTDPGRFRG
ncbi:MAG: FAD-dependent oxidoreductase [Actinobacteria bacterium]|nr:FAD-binding oxidoreductase [Acidobacteriota bacterium]MCZ6506212.1 FAD-dependent oxidoreductase [Actinomycetota bacterium]